MDPLGTATRLKAIGIELAQKLEGDKQVEVARKGAEQEDEEAPANVKHDEMIKIVTAELRELKELIPRIVQRVHEQVAVSKERARRARSKREGISSRSEIDNMVLGLIDEHKARYHTLAQGSLESQRHWDHRLWHLNRSIVKIWNTNRNIIMDSEPRYVEGLPIRELVRPPIPVKPHGPVYKDSGVIKCLQCRAKDMRCSKTRKIPNLDEFGPCTRCVRNGDGCIGLVEAMPYWEDGKEWRWRWSVLGQSSTALKMKGAALEEEVKEDSERTESIVDAEEQTFGMEELLLILGARKGDSMTVDLLGSGFKGFIGENRKNWVLPLWHDGRNAV